MLGTLSKPELALVPWANKNACCITQGAKASIHRDKIRVQMLAKIFPHLKVKC
jgi:hypothetical protein